MHTNRQATTPQAVPLVYSIASSTPHSGKYSPENIMIDRPQDQSSRWSGAFQGNANQWITLRLEALAVLKTITFGKFFKPHPCNMKEFKVLVGMTEDHMTEILRAGLKNDFTPEKFDLDDGSGFRAPFPTRFVKIVPIFGHGQNFHISIWHVAMTGIIDPNYVESVRVSYEEHRETLALRYVLKHLRQRRLLTPYQSILSRANIQLEHPLVTQLHESLVLQGNWLRSEQLLEQLSSADLFRDHLSSCQPYSVWTRLSGTDADGDVPPARGGHAMCMDPVNRVIYIFGGWDGEKSLDDFWAYSVKDDKWTVLSHGTSLEPNAPGARSCHKMVFDTKTGSIYLLGRLNDTDGLGQRTPPHIRNPHGPMPMPPSSTSQSQTQGTTQSQEQRQPAQSQDSTPPVDEGLAAAPRTYCSEFYRYHTRGADIGKWDFLSFDTASSGGPPLVFDHQMAMDCESQILYVFGGRVVGGDWNNPSYAGLYSYNVRLSKWKLLQATENAHGSQIIIPPRFGHSMVLDSRSKMLYIFAGQREEKYLSDMYAYDIRNGVTTEIFTNFSVAGGPDACFTQRAVIDPVLKEIYVFCGLTRNANRNVLQGHLSNWVYRYDKRPGKWNQILREPDRSVSETPMPRFAHQVVYDPSTQSVYLHGGNAGGTVTGDLASRQMARDADGTTPGVEDGRGGSGSHSKEKEGRLDDFWKMQLKRPGPEETIRQAKFLIRRQRFREMSEEGPPVKALSFLQTQVSSVVDHKNAQETEIFRSLLTHLLSPPPVPPRSPIKTPSPGLSDSDSASSTSSRLEHDDSREVSSRPKKRSRGEKSEGSGSEGEVWTNELALDTPDPLMLSGSNTQRMRDVTDPLELIIRGEADASKDTRLNGERYGQRTEVFDALLKFISDGEKQPSESLLDLVEQYSEISGMVSR